MIAYIKRFFRVRKYESTIEPMDDASLLGRVLLLNLRRTTIY